MDCNCSSIRQELHCKGAVIFKAGYRGGRIFGGVPNFLASFYRVSSMLEKIIKYLMGCEMECILD